MHDFGIISEKIVNGTVRELVDATDTSWLTIAEEYPHPYYIVVDINGRIIAMTNKASGMTIAGKRVYGIDSNYGYTFGYEGTIYNNKKWDVDTNTIVEYVPPIPDESRPDIDSLGYMQQSVYDENLKHANVYNMASMEEANDALILKNAEREDIAKIGGIETTLATKASKTELKTVKDVVDTHTTEIASKASQTEVDSIQTVLTAHGEQIANKVEQSDFITLTNKVNTKADKTDLTNLATIVGNKTDKNDFDALVSSTNTNAIALTNLTTEVADKANTADLKALAYKDKAGIADIAATGTASASTFLAGDGSWKAVEASSGGGGGDMDKDVYDPTNVSNDAFSMDSMKETTTKKILTADERQAIINHTNALAGVGTYIDNGLAKKFDKVFPALDINTDLNTVRTAGGYTLSSKYKNGPFADDVVYTGQMIVTNRFYGARTTTQIIYVQDEMYIRVGIWDDTGNNCPWQKVITSKDKPFSRTFPVLPATDLDTLLDAGGYTLEGPRSYTNAPYPSDSGNNWGLLIVYNRDNVGARATQIAIVRNEMYIRMGVSADKLNIPWQRVLTSKDDVVQNKGRITGKDANDLVDPGIYYAQVSADATQELNFPVNASGVLQVFKLINTDHPTAWPRVIQTYTTSGSMIYSRFGERKSDGNVVWNAWFKQIDERGGTFTNNITIKRDNQYSSLTINVPDGTLEGGGMYMIPVTGGARTDFGYKAGGGIRTTIAGSGEIMSVTKDLATFKQDVVIDANAQYSFSTVKVKDGTAYGGGFELAPVTGGRKTQFAYYPDGGARIYVEDAGDIATFPAFGPVSFKWGVDNNNGGQYAVYGVTIADGTAQGGALVFTPTTGGSVSRVLYAAGGGILLNTDAGGDIIAFKPNAITTSKPITSTSTIVSADTSIASDRRFKKDIGKISDALDRVCSLEGVTFINRKDMTNKVQIGLIAQDVEKVVPEVVRFNDELEGLTVAYPNLAALFVEAIKELKAEIDDLKKKVK